MLLPADHPLVADPKLAQFHDAADELCAGGEVIATLRHLPQRRVALLVEHPQHGLAVMKVFASPRARGNDRRLRTLKSGPVHDMVPTPLELHRSGHACLIGFVPGTVLDQLQGRELVAAAYATGVALRRLHTSGTVLDREWTITDEVALLRKRATPRTSGLVDDLVGRCAHLEGEALVSAHRDFHPRQVVAMDGRVSFIDLDDAAMAPAGLDVGNFIAHLRRDGATGLLGAEDATAAIGAFRRGYGVVDSDVVMWERLSLVRLAGLAESRHGRADLAEAIIDHLRVHTPAR